MYQLRHCRRLAFRMTDLLLSTTSVKTRASTSTRFAPARCCGEKKEQEHRRRRRRRGKRRSRKVGWSSERATEFH